MNPLRCASRPWARLAGLICLSAMLASCAAAGPQGADGDPDSAVFVQVDDKVRLETFLEMPFPQIKNVPAIIVLHGYDGNARELSYTTGRLRLEGFATLAISMRGWGRSSGTDDCGFRQADDLVKMVNWLAQQDGIDPQRIGVLGYSQGGQVALLGAEKSDHIKSVVAISSVSDVARWGETTTHPGIPYYVSNICSDDLQARSPIAHPERLRAPTLLVHGGRDSRVPAEQSILMQQAIAKAGGEASLHLVPGAKHALSYEEWQSAWKVMLAHLNSTLRPGSAILATPPAGGSLPAWLASLQSGRLIAFPGYPVLGISRPAAKRTEVVYVTPACPYCAQRLMGILTARDSQDTNLVIVMGATRDVELAITARLFCAPPPVALANILSYFDNLLRSDFSHGAASESDLALLFEGVAFTSAVEAHPAVVDACLDTESFLRTIGAATAASKDHLSRLPANPTEETINDALKRLSMSGLTGGTGAGPKPRFDAEGRRAKKEWAAYWAAESKKNDRIIAALDFAILTVNGIDIVNSMVFSKVPGGSIVYAGSKTVTNIVLGEKEAAVKSAIGLVTPALDKYAPVLAEKMPGLSKVAPILGKSGTAIDRVIDLQTLTVDLRYILN